MGKGDGDGIGFVCKKKNCVRALKNYDDKPLLATRGSNNNEIFGAQRIDTLSLSRVVFGRRASVDLYYVIVT